MKTLILSRLKRFILPLLLIIPMCYAGSIYAATITVDCNSVANAHDAIQAAIDSAASGDVINLVGVCQLEGKDISISKSNLTIQGVGASGNWSTVLKGLIDPSTGKPLGDKGSADNFAFYNRGITFGPTNSVIQNVVIQGIKFQDLNRGIMVTPSVNATTLDCNNTTITGGTGKYITINNNFFENNIRDVSVYGTSDHVKIADNNFDKTRGIDVFTNGVIYRCAIGNPLPLGIPTATIISGNKATNDMSTANTIQLQTSDLTVITNNILVNNSCVGNVGLFSVTNATVANNAMDGGGCANGVYETDADPGFVTGILSTGTQVRDNQISNAFGPIVIDNGTAGISVINNQFINTVYNLFGFHISDIYLCGGIQDFVQCYSTPGTPSFNNKVVTTNFSTEVTNLGVNNQIIGTQNLINSPNVPADVKNNLITDAKGRPQSNQP